MIFINKNLFIIEENHVTENFCILNHKQMYMWTCTTLSLTHQLIYRNSKVLWNE